MIPRFPGAQALFDLSHVGGFPVRLRKPTSVAEDPGQTVNGHNSLIERIKSMRYMLYCSVLLMFSSSLSAQEACLALLDHGLYDEFISSGLSTRYTEMHNEVCSAYESYKSDAKSDKVKASYSLFKGGASFAATKIQSVGQFMCETGSTVQDALDRSNEISRVINPRAIAAFSECVTSSHSNLIVETFFGSDVTDALVISLRYHVRNQPNAAASIDAIQYETNQLTCDGSLIDALNSGESLQDSEKSIRCRRQIPDEPTTILGREIWLTSTDITLATEAGTVVRRLPAVGVGPKPLAESERRLRTIPPVGTVIASLLGWEQFQNSQVDVGHHWVPADGRTIPANSKYAEITGTDVVPDLRGLFLRGLNTFQLGLTRTDGKEDPEGSARRAGILQGHSVGSHKHYVEGIWSKAPLLNPGSGQVIINPLWPPTDYPKKATARAFEDPGKETRPKNAAVYYYVRVN